MSTGIQPTMQITIPSELGYEVVARDAVAALAKRLGFPFERIENMKTALCEACINAIEHGNSLQPGMQVQIFCWVNPEDFLIDVCDQGVLPFTVYPEPATISEKVEGFGRLRGMGLLLIEELTDEAGFLADEHAGNCFRLAFHRH